MFIQGLQTGCGRKPIPPEVLDWIQPQRSGAQACLFWQHCDGWHDVRLLHAWI